MSSTVIIDLYAGCTRPKCRDLAFKEHEALGIQKYSVGAAVAWVFSLPIWLSEHGTARRRAGRAARKGYYVETFEPRDHHEDMLEINRSKAERQGRPMADHYINKVKTTGAIGPSPCPFHHRLEYGVFTPEGKLVAYAGMIRCGELLHVSMFIGHWDYLDDGIMYFLMREVLAAELATEKVALYYNRYDSGKEGLRFYKDRIGLKEQDIKWMLSS